MLMPYSGSNWIDFICTFFERLPLILLGQTPLCSDEIQFLVLALVGTSTALVGVFLIYRKMTMQANALSHSVLFGIALTYLILKTSHHHFNANLNFQSLFIAALITGFVTAFMTHLIVKLSKLQKDAATGLVFTCLFALGIILISLFSRNSHIGLELVLGNVDAVHIKDAQNGAWMLLVNIGLIFFFFPGLKLTTFDPIYSYLQKISLSFYHYLMIFLLSFTSIGSFNAVGVVLVLSFFIIPPLIAKEYVKTLSQQLMFSALIGIVCAFLGVCLSRHFLSQYQVALSTGGITVLVLYGLFFIQWFFKVVIKQFLRWNLIKKSDLKTISP